MKERLKRSIALILALALVITTVITDNLMAVQASTDKTGKEAVRETKSITVNLGNPDISDMSELPGLVADHPLDLVLKVTYGDKNNTEEKEFIINDLSLNCPIPYDSSYTYEYVLESGSYDLTLEEGQVTEGTLSAEDLEGGVSFDVVSVAPKYSLKSISGSTQLMVGETAEIQAELEQGENAAWNKDQISWSVEGANASYLTVSQDPQDSSKCTITAAAELPVEVELVDVTVRAVGADSETNCADTTVNISKKALGITITGDDKLDWSQAYVTVQLSENIQKEVTLYDNDNDAVIDRKTTDDSGKVDFALNGGKGKTYDLTAKTEADTVYKAGEGKYKYSPKNKNSIIEFKLDGNLSVTYGDFEEIGFISITEGEGTFETQAITVINGEEKENGTVTVNSENNKVSYKPAFPGTVKIRIRMKGSEGYNASAWAEQNVSVAKKVVTVNQNDVKAVSKTYDKITDNIVVTAVVSGTVPDDGEIRLETSDGKTELVDAGKQNVTATLNLSETDFEKYAFKDDEGKLTRSIKVNTTVMIDKAPLKVVVGNATKEWHLENDESNLTFTTNKITYSGFCEGDQKKKDPSIKISIPEEYELVEYEGALSIADDADVTGNYYINSVVPGNLTIIAQKNVDFTQYISIDNTGKLENHVYQPDKNDPLIYCGPNRAKAKFSFKNNESNYYTKLWMNDESEVKDENEEIVFQIPGHENVSENTFSQSFFLTDEDANKKTEYFNVKFTYDDYAPKVTIKEDNNDITLEKLTEAITFGLFHNEKKTVTITVSENEGEAGLASWSYCVVHPDDDSKLSLEDIESMTYEKKMLAVKNTFMAAEFMDGDGSKVEIPLDSNNYYVVYVVAVDNVGNSVLVGSNGIIIENIDLNAIDVKLNDLEPNEQELYFMQEVKMSVSINDNKDSIYSGVLKSSYQLTVDNQLIDPSEYSENLQNLNVILNYDKDDKYGILVDNSETEDEDNTGSKKWTLKDVHDCVVDKTLKMDVEEGHSRKFDVAIQAEDFASNKAPDKNFSFVIDRKKPVISMSINAEEAEKAVEGYYNTDKVVVQTDITERYIDKEGIVFTITKDGVEDDPVSLQDLENKTNDEKKAYGLKSVSSTLSNGESDASTSTIMLEFDQNANYIVEVNAVDRAGNSAEQSGKKEFHIDTVAPVAQYTFSAHSSKNAEGVFAASGIEEEPTYLIGDENGPASFDVVVSVTETNFTTDNVNYEIVGKDSGDSKIAYIAKYNNGDSIVDINSEGISEHCGNIANWKNQEYKLTFTEDANYSFKFRIYDKAGNESNLIGPDYVTLDNTKPEGTVTVNGFVNSDKTSIAWINEFFDRIFFGLFGNSSMTAEVSGSDQTSGVDSVQYYVSQTGMTKEDLSSSSVGWKPYTGEIPLTADKNVIVYEKVTDKAGNYEYYSSNSFTLDKTDPAPVITITPTAPSWGKGVYSAKDNPGFNITVEDPTVNNAYSGLRQISYKIVNGTTGAAEEGVLASFEKTDHKPTWTGHVSVDPEKFYSNDVQITVTASDWSANEKTSETAKMKIDNKAPIVKFSFDKSDVLNGKYHKNNKTLTITVDERNFDPSYTPSVTSSAGGGYSFSGWSTSGETTTGTITFSGDSDYTVTFDCYDLAGNKSNTEKLEEFTVDKTLPVINVSYDNNSVQNGSYYKAARTATITITEHNFRAGDVKISTTASDGSAPKVSGWSDSGDRHTATVYFGNNADYTFDVSYADLAGNNAADYAQDNFTVDLTKPSVEITGVANKSANKGTVAPSITIEDTNFISNGVTITLKGAKKGNVDISGMVSRTSTETGQSVIFRNFGDDMDDIYTLTAKSVDKAGNETSKTIMFSVNRYGSTYKLSKDTEELLEKGYTNKPVDIVIEEYNVDTLEFIELSYSKDGGIVKLTRDKDYTVKSEGGEGQWKKYTYTILAKCFEEEGEYNINISSVDRAQNQSNNKVQSKNVAFVVDKTAPVMAISNLDNRGRYTESSHQFTLNVKDNMRLSKVELYLDGELVHTYKGDELTVEDGKIYIDIDSKNVYQKVKMIAYDEAGNPTEPVEYSVLVTTNRWIQFTANKPLFYGSIAALIAAAGLIFFLIFWKKKKETEKTK